MRAFERICGDERRLGKLASMFFAGGVWLDCDITCSAIVSRYRSSEAWDCGHHLAIKAHMQSREILMWAVATQLLSVTGFNDVHARNWTLKHQAAKEVQRRRDALASPIGPLPKNLEPSASSARVPLAEICKTPEVLQCSAA
jgi:hypothetical protein